jgi:hypothetical protein
VALCVFRMPVCLGRPPPHAAAAGRGGVNEALRA